ILAVILVQKSGTGTDENTVAGEVGDEVLSGDAEFGSADAENGTEDSSLSDEDGSSQDGSGASSEDDAENSISGEIGTGEGISFPYTAELDELELVAVYDYSGYYIEDGSESEIDSVAALEVTNTSDEIIEYAEITMTADGKTLTFDVSLLPAGETVLVMEADQKSCSETAVFTYEESVIAYLSELDMCEDQVRVTENDSGSITVTNISGEDISELRLFYKNQLDTGEYIGGIAYTVKLEDLASGASMTVSPSHYDPEYGVVMMVRIYD
ncbi:MAG: hypothetical protein LUG54_05200, partial [Clostridiales bacterium]|nr:hypothetical protein [Clostridiales bacterium]